MKAACNKKWTVNVRQMSGEEGEAVTHEQGSFCEVEKNNK